MGNEGENSYRKKPVVVSAFQWNGDVRDPHNIPAWVKTLSRSATLNEATDPPGLILDTIVWGGLHVPHTCWFIHDVGSGNVFKRTDEAFKRDYEPTVTRHQDAGPAV